MPDEPNLFGVSRKKVRKKSPPVPDGAMTRLIAIYRDVFHAKFGEFPVVTKADAALLKRLVVQFGVEKVDARLRAYLAWDDRFLRECGYTLRVFHVKWNELATRYAVADASRAGVEATDHYRQTLRAARAARHK